MKNPSFLSLPASLLIFAFLLSNSVRVDAQSVKVDPADAAKIAKAVHLRLGLTTLRQIAAVLSAQTGLLIEPASYLSERTLNAQMEDVSAQQAVEALLELNDWRWRKLETGHYEITRPPVLVTTDPIQIGKAFPLLFPVDLRFYLGIADGLEGRLPSNLPARAVSRFHQGEDRISDYRHYYAPQLRAQETSALYTDLKPQFLKREQIPVALLTPEQKERLVWLITMKALSGTDDYVLAGRFAPYLLHLDDADVEVDSGNSLMMMLNPVGPIIPAGSAIRGKSGLSISVTPTPGQPETPLERLNNILRTRRPGGSAAGN